jgi:mono/diheme cytochrome c family protein
MEPATGSARAPVWLFVLMAVLAFWGMGFLDEHAGGFNPQVYEPYASLSEVDGDRPRSTGDEAFKRGQFVYEEKAKCMACHQPTGLGSPGQYPPLAGSDWVLAKEPGRIIRIVLDGLQGPITVLDKPFNQAMVPWKDVLNDQEIADVLTYVRQNKAWGNDASAVTPEQVKAIRAKVAGRSTSWSPDELLKVPETE